MFVATDGRTLRTIIRDRIADDCSISWEELAELFDFDVLSVIGKDRVAFRTGNDTVVKVARDAWAIGLNEDEYKFWDTFGTATLFAPVLNVAPDFAWIEMPYCEPAPDEMEAYREKVEGAGYTVPDLTTSCIGWYNGEVVCFDYPEATV